MKNHNNFYMMLVIFVVSGLSAFYFCVKADAYEEKTLKGNIYLGGAIFGKINLESKKWEAIYTDTNHIYCEFPNFVNNNLFILETKGSQIEYFDSAFSNFTFIVEGVSPLYVSEVRSIFYYKYNQGLFQKFLDENRDDKFITSDIYFSASLIQPPPIRVSSGEVIYYTKDKKIGIYDYTKASHRFLDVVGYEPSAFYVNKNSLICKNKSDNNLYFINIDTSKKEIISIENAALIEPGIVPINEYRCFIYSKYRGGPFFWESEYKDAYIYWVDKKKEELYIKNCDITYGVYSLK